MISTFLALDNKLRVLKDSVLALGDTFICVYRTGNTFFVSYINIFWRWSLDNTLVSPGITLIQG